VDTAAANYLADQLAHLSTEEHFRHARSYMQRIKTGLALTERNNRPKLESIALCCGIKEVIPFERHGMSATSELLETATGYKQLFVVATSALVRPSLRPLVDVALYEDIVRYTGLVTADLCDDIDTACMLRTLVPELHSIAYSAHQRFNFWNKTATPLLPRRTLEEQQLDEQRLNKRRGNYAAEE
jgi:hypothetical protein